MLNSGYFMAFLIVIGAVVLILALCAAESIKIEREAKRVWVKALLMDYREKERQRQIDFNRELAGQSGISSATPLFIQPQ